MFTPRTVATAAAVFLVILLPGWLPAESPSPGDARQQVVDLENRWLASENDPSALEEILADDFVHVFAFGFITKAQHIAYVRTHPVPDAGARRFEDLRVRIYGVAAIANGIVVHTGPHGAVRKTVFTDVFAFRRGKWQAVNAQELPFQPLAPPAKPAAP